MLAMDRDQPCAGCGKPTAAGRALFADRRTIDHADGQRSYVCSLCDARLSASHHPGQLSDDEVRRLIDTGSMAGVLWSGGGLGIGSS
jgi:hypothetical protein